MQTRVLRLAAMAAVLLLSLSATLVSAGGGAEIVPDQENPPEPRAGEDFDFGFTVMQHGVTPAGWEDPTVTITNAITGESASFPAEPGGADGHFSAVVRLPEAGLYTWTVDLRDLIVTSPPVTATVLETDGSRPSIDVAHAFTAIETARRTLGMELREEVNGRIDMLTRSVDGLQATDAALRTRVASLVEERDALNARVAELESAANPAAPAGDPSAVPVLGVVTLAVLAGAMAGFAMAWLSGRRAPVQVKPTPARTPLTT